MYEESVSLKIIYGILSLMTEEQLEVLEELITGSLVL